MNPVVSVAAVGIWDLHWKVPPLAAGHWISRLQHAIAVNLNIETSLPALHIKIESESFELGFIELKLVKGMLQSSFQTSDDVLSNSKFKQRPGPNFILNIMHLEFPPQQFIPVLLLEMVCMLPVVGRLTLNMLGLVPHPN